MFVTNEHHRIVCRQKQIKTIFLRKGTLHSLHLIDEQFMIKESSRPFYLIDIRNSGRIRKQNNVFSLSFFLHLHFLFL